MGQHALISQGETANAAADQPARILFPFAGGMMGGSHISALLLATHVDRARFQPVVLLHQPGGALGAHLAELGIEPLIAPEAVEPLEGLAALLALPARARLLREERIDIVHSNEGNMHLLWTPAARLAGVKTVWHQRGQPNARAVRFLAPLTADRVLTVSRFATPRAGLYSVARRSEVVFSPFDCDQVRRPDDATLVALRAQVGADGDGLVLGYFAHIVERKRPLDFVEAVRHAQRLLPGRRVVGLMFGDVWDSALDTLVAERVEALADQVTIHRMGFRRPIEPWMAACDMNVVTALDEPLGRSLVEAMLLGTSVVAVRSGGNDEALVDGETGVLVPPCDPERMAEAISRLAETGFARTISARAEADARKRFGIDRHLETVSRVYSEVLAR